MKMKYTAFIIMVLFITGYLLIPQRGFSRIQTNVAPDISADQLKAFVVEDFEDESKIGSEDGWRLTSVPRQLKEDSKKMKNPVPVLEQKIIAGRPNDMRPDVWSANEKGIKNDRVDKVQKVYGVHFRFQYPGDNSVHFEPPVNPELTPAGSNEKFRGIKLPGRARALSMWVHGRGNDYNLEAWIKDYTGRVHIISFGSLNFVGWRPMRAYIPVNIPQSVDSYPQTKFLRVERFVLRATPNASTEDTYFFFDQLKLLTDDFEVNFDGQELDKAFRGDTESKAGAQQKQ